MTTTSATTGSASRWGPLWGARARDWAGVEEQQHPTYAAVLDHVGLPAGGRVLEVGCGSGVFLRSAADRGLEAHGVDASPELVALARDRVPEADVRVGDMEALPYPDASFDLVAGFNSFFFAADMVAALAEAGRVARPGAHVVAQVWGRPDRCNLEAMKQALAPFLPPPDPAARAAPALWQPGVLEGLLAAAGLTPTATFDVSWAYRFADDEALARALLSPGIVVAAIASAGEDAVRDAIVRGMAPYRNDDGYTVENEWHVAVAVR